MVLLLSSDMALSETAPSPQVPASAVPSAARRGSTAASGVFTGGYGAASPRAADGCWRRRGRWRSWGQRSNGWRWRRDRRGGDSGDREGKIGETSTPATWPREACWCTTETGIPAGRPPTEPWFRLSAGRRPRICRQDRSEVLASRGVVQDRAAAEERRPFCRIGSASGVERGSSVCPCSSHPKGRRCGEGQGGCQGTEGRQGTQNETKTPSGLPASASRFRGSAGHQLKPHFGSIIAYQLFLLVVCAWLRRILEAIALHTKTHSCRSDTLPGQVAAPTDSTVSPSSYSSEAASCIQDYSGGTAWKRHFQQRGHHERCFPRGSAECGDDGSLERTGRQFPHTGGVFLPLLRLSRRRPDSGGRPEHVHLPRASETHVSCRGRAQLPAALQSPCGWSVCHKDRAFLPRQRLFQPLLGLGRGRRRYGIPRSTGWPRDNPSPGMDSEVHNDQAHQKKTIGMEGTQQTAENLRKAVPPRRPQHRRLQALSRLGTPSVHTHPGRRRGTSSQYQGYTGASRRSSDDPCIYNYISATSTISREILILNGGHLRLDPPARDLEKNRFGELDQALKSSVSHISNKCCQVLQNLVLTKLCEDTVYFYLSSTATASLCCLGQVIRE